MTEHPAPPLVFRSVSQRYRRGWQRGRQALDRLDLELAPGTSLGLVGPNGAGKSTCLRLAAGIERPSSGSVELFGRPAEEAPARQRMGYVPEGFPFPLELRARAALDLLARLAGVPRASRRERVPRFLERVGLARSAGERLGSYSSGMRRRFSLAQAFLHEPDLVLLDEPTAGLDGPGFEVLQTFLEEARRRGASLVLASHVPTLLRQTCDALMLLVDGRTKASGSPTEILGEDGEHRSLLAYLSTLYSAEGSA